VYVQAVGTVEEFLVCPSAAKLEHLGDDPGRVLVDALGVSLVFVMCTYLLST